VYWASKRTGKAPGEGGCGVATCDAAIFSSVGAAPTVKLLLPELTPPLKNEIVSSADDLQMVPEVE
jgi:hypothetical protein